MCVRASTKQNWTQTLRGSMQVVSRSFPVSKFNPADVKQWDESGSPVALLALQAEDVCHVHGLVARCVCECVCVWAGVLKSRVDWREISSWVRSAALSCAGNFELPYLLATQQGVNQAARQRHQVQ